MRTEIDKFFKSLREMRYCDWAIEKRLIEAGGIGKTVYILPARGGSRFPYEAIERYREEGRDVRLLHAARGNGKWRTVDKYLEEQEKLLAKLELFEVPGGHISDRLLQELRAGTVIDRAREKLWITSVRPDSYPHYTMQDFLLNPNYGILYKKEGSACP